MKSVKLFFAAIIVLIVGVSAYAIQGVVPQKSGTKTDTVKVLGNCSMCKMRIERAAMVAGVSSASWNGRTKVLTITYNPSQIKNEDIQKRIAAAGHDTEKYRATDKAYNSLPGCCQYERH